MNIKLLFVLVQHQAVALEAPIVLTDAGHYESHADYRCQSSLGRSSCFRLFEQFFPDLRNSSTRRYFVPGCSSSRDCTATTLPEKFLQPDS